MRTKIGAPEIANISIVELLLVPYARHGMNNEVVVRYFYGGNLFDNFSRNL